MTPPPFEPVAAVPVLEYGTPPRRRAFVLRLMFGVAAFLMSLGAGTAVFGVLMAFGYRDDDAGPVGIGVGLFFCGGFIMAYVLWLRFVPISVRR